MLGAVFQSLSTMHARLPELVELEHLIEDGAAQLSTRVVHQVDVGTHSLPVYAITLGNPDPGIPAIGFFGGVHGLERIGAQVVIAYLQNLVSRLRWDRVLHQQLDQVRLVFMPLVNPGGLWRRTRANPNGVDLMRNSPVNAREKVPFLIGGQRWSRTLPWFRGAANSDMEPEAQALCEVVDSELLTRSFSMAIDCHSGFGVADRIWFPYAHTAHPIPHLAEMYALNQILDQSHLHHRYVFEPQSYQYLAHGDLWDHLYLRAQQDPARIFLPLTLEMGSWLWVKKNPRQLFSRLGMFNPSIRHRQQRVLRRHLSWLDFMTRAAASHMLWQAQGDEREKQHQEALQHWYRPP
jgi:hypothetical protein